MTIKHSKKMDTFLIFVDKYYVDSTLYRINYKMDKFDKPPKKIEILQRNIFEPNMFGASTLFGITLNNAPLPDSLLMAERIGNPDFIKMVITNLRSFYGNDFVLVSHLVDRMMSIESTPYGDVYNEALFPYLPVTDDSLFVISAIRGGNKTNFAHVYKNQNIYGRINLFSQTVIDFCRKDIKYIDSFYMLSICVNEFVAAYRLIHILIPGKETEELLLDLKNITH